MAVLPFASYRGIDAPGATTSGDLHDEFVQTADTTAQSIRGDARHGVGQSWDSGADPSEVAGVVFRVRRESLLGSRGVVWASVYAHSGTYGTSSVPTGDPLVRSPVYAMEDVPATYTNLFFPLSGWTPTANTDYIAVIEGDPVFGNSGSAERVAVVDEDGSEATHGGNASVRPLGAAWSELGSQDTAFKVYYASEAAAGDEAYRFRANALNRRRFGALFGLLLMLALGCTSPTAMREDPCFKATIWVDTLTFEVDSVTYEWTPGECD